MLTLVMVLAVAQVSPASAGDAPVKDETASRPSSPALTGDDRPHVDGPGRSAGLFEEPRVGSGALVGRMAMGLLGFGLAAAPVTALMVVAAYSGLPTVMLVGGVILGAALMALGTAAGASLFGSNYAHDFGDALLVSTVCATIGGLMFVLGFFVPAMLLPMLVLAGGLMVVGVPLFVQAFKRSDAPEATVALLRF